ncbi:MAG: DMT family transporter [Anaerolineaceae bacterium]|nr:DMT family transporter [Anaerolineaceae bacterium]MCY3936666.1 DMT family transporter [Chloroflexota bacterium]MCY4009400.1 DMT family transporter [Anaerolineaceae bacterium]
MSEPLAAKPGHALSWSGIGYMVSSVAALGFMHSLVRQIYEATDYEITALQVSMWRFAISAIVLWVFTLLAFREGHPFGAESRRLSWRAAAVGFFYSFSSIAMYTSTRFIPVPVFIVLFYTYPMIISLLSSLLGMRLPRLFWLALVLTLAGVVLTVATELAGIDEMGAEAPLGIFAALAAAGLIASYIVANQRILRSQGSDLQTVAIGVSWMISSGALTLIVIAFLSGQGLGLAVAREIWLQLIFLGLLVSFAIYAMNVGVQRLGGPQAALVGNVEIIFTMLFAWLWLGEWLESLQFFGGALILGSVVTYARWQMQQR